MSKLAGKVAVVTGASQGLGARIAIALAAEGAAVVVDYPAEQAQANAEAVVARITQAGGVAVAVQADVSNAADANALVEAAVQRFGHLDILVNNAGVYEVAPLEAITEAHFHRHFDINVLGLLLVTQAAAKHLREGGSIINLSSLATTVVPAGMAVYTATKGAVEAITGVLSRELGPRGIRVNAISPGLVETEGTHAVGFIGSDFAAGVVAQTPFGRLGQPEDIAPVVVFLASDDSHWVTGERLRVAGGHR